MIFECVLYFGWPNQPSSGTMGILHWNVIFIYLLFYLFIILFIYLFLFFSPNWTANDPGPEMIPYWTANDPDQKTGNGMDGGIVWIGNWRT